MAYNCVKYNGKECDGCGECQPDTEYYCPVCGELVEDRIYISAEGDILGCENCIREKDPREMIEDGKGD
jgi:hypothetical protein